MQYEKVPRFKKRPGDVVLEGSNNSLIVLGTDRIGPIATYVPSPPPPEGAKPDKNFAKGLTPVLEDVYKDEAGSIDMVVGRGYSEETGGDSIESKSILGNQPIKEELDKYNPPENEGDPDFKNDRSRILISQRTSVDHNFKLTDYMIDATRRGPTGALLDSENGDAAIMIKSDKIRLVARSDISLIVTNYKVDEEAPVNNEYKTESEDKKEWASIIIRSNGDIIFTPSEKGLIKLGGDDADKAILCTDNLTRKPTVKNGKVIFKPGITTTGIDFVGTGAANQGTFAKKILVK
jgi:hypothetical protein